MAGLTKTALAASIKSRTIGMIILLYQTCNG